VKDDKKHQDDFLDKYPDHNSIASANEFTGLISSAIDTHWEAEAYSEEFHIHEQTEVCFDEDAADDK